MADRRNFFKLGSVAASLFLSQKLSKTKELSPYKLEFVLYYPKNKTLAEAQIDMQKIFQKDITVTVDTLCEINSLILTKEYLYHDDHFVYTATFRSKEAYEQWESMLAQSSAFNKNLMDELGYRFVTQQV